jgi:2-polyprenyl-6-hydroxyphenyl methylase/3-demethylubiquinone-9 3-methyltransferase
LSIDYRHGWGEDLPVADASADLVYCVDVLEHVRDLDAVIAETARVLKPGGLYLYDTINRTRLSRLVMIKLSQEWQPTAWLPPDLHDWDHFITPAELTAALRRHGLRDDDLTGMAPGVRPPGMVRLMRGAKKGKFSYAEFGRRAAFVLTEDTRILYVGRATRLSA